jgi:cellulose synthase/poly-beta-1,6-N-acetylglucosamine synthase-like glycosyltransferase
MNSGVSVRLIIAVYKNTTFLKKVLDSVEQQTYRNFNVSIVEDGNSEVMRNFIAQIAYSFPVTHYTQEDIGFRKNKILNVALRDAHEDLCVFIDGDCVLHPTYLKTYVKYFDSNTVLYAKRTNLDAKTSEKLLCSNAILPSKWDMILNGSTRVEDSFSLPWKPVKFKNNPNILGCNMAIPLHILRTVNGFDEDYEITGYGEDCDIEWRMKKAGFKFMDLKFHVIQFHLYHERPEREDQTAISRKMYHEKMELGEVFCKNGLLKSF